MSWQLRCWTLSATSPKRPGKASGFAFCVRRALHMVWRARRKHLAKPCLKSRVFRMVAGVVRKRTCGRCLKHCVRYIPPGKTAVAHLSCVVRFRKTRDLRHEPLETFLCVGAEGPLVVRARKDAFRMRFGGLRMIARPSLNLQMLCNKSGGIGGMLAGEVRCSKLADFKRRQGRPTARL